MDELVEAETELFTVQLATGGCGGLKQVEASSMHHFVMGCVDGAYYVK